MATADKSISLQPVDVVPQEKVAADIPSTDSTEGVVSKHHRPHRKSFFQWVPSDDEQLAHSEHRMLASIKDCMQQKMVAGLNTIYWVQPEHKRTLVLLHGFAGGVGNWLPNWKDLIQYTNVYAVDMPGFARSERPKVTFKTADDAIEFMTDSVLAWMKEMGIEGKVDLCGHSFGGYISANFAMKYPTKIDHLVLADPWGMQPAHDRKLPFKFRVALKLFYAGNPLSVLRGAGPWGPTLLPKIRKDFADRWAPYIDDPNIFYDYTFHCNAHSNPVGERAFQACCVGTAFAKYPLFETVPKSLDKSIPINIIYGSNTWMDKGTGHLLVDKLQEQGHTAGYSHVPNAGHQVMSDNAKDFSNQLLCALGYLSSF